MIEMTNEEILQLAEQHFDYQGGWIAYIKEDLLKFALKRQAQGPDAKVEEMLEHLTEIATDAARPDKHGLSSGDRRKVIVFTTYTDTVEDLHKRVVQAVNKAPKTHRCTPIRAELHQLYSVLGVARRKMIARPHSLDLLR